MSLQKHLRILAGGVEETRPDDSLNVAFATTDRKHVDQHFGAAQAFAVYSINPDHASLVEYAQFGELKFDGHEDKLAPKLALLKGCAAVYCQAVGGSAIRQLMAVGIQPVRVEERAPIDQLIRDLQADWRDGNAPWVQKALQRRQAPTDDRFAAMESEGWQE
ncbi:MAG: nitrogen fixation protein NifX [Gammaproteobacteria bacterium]|nr:nitrogen fixation protein NifX [Gammaproteobacteria bacterium]MCP5425834.1 nitrogen fixation protein NifX [Gammaproteobacteria bacterium]MCP5458556.1 nitrogen fixation protein NifX [Gammaproteobacteria bacterium]